MDPDSGLNSEKDGPWKSWVTKKLDLEKPEDWKDLDAEKPGHWNTFTGQKLDAEKLLQDHIVWFYANHKTTWDLENFLEKFEM